MPSPYPAKITTDDGVTALSGEVAFTDPANQPVSSVTAAGPTITVGGTSADPTIGVTPVTAHGQYVGNFVTVGNGAQGPLTWDTFASGTALLDLTAPAAPTVITAGIYAVSATLECATALTAGGGWQGTLDLDLNGDDLGTEGTAGADGAFFSPTLSLALVSYVPAGGVIEAAVKNHDGVAGRDFKILIATVQRIT